ncbi:flavodoxin family protein [Anaeromyxobacter oryzae]|uniref:Flavodoxin-like domain-containing protein n=1 Tax=Anaeromyxobacter oryzae TaxID=2918170 RepID=A0ABM7WT86_9BACT|nr:flavodoxin [Anaeromyxobacter oryzae]BDG02673.1 hypothetical protein AMOR_16690 [Anaeromyxobacter oryzae]
MATPRILVAHYSRSGRTRRIAEELAEALGADLEPIRDRTDRRGIVGYLRSGFESLLAASGPIERPAHDPGRYDLVVVGTPVWASGLSTPVRTWLWMEHDRLPRVAFFLTHGGSGAARVFGQMTRLAGKPVATLALREGEIDRDRHAEKLAAFAAEVQQRAARAARRRRRSA